MLTRKGLRDSMMEVTNKSHIWILKKDTPIPKEIIKRVDDDNQEHILVKPGCSKVSVDIFKEVRKSNSSCLVQNRVLTYILKHPD